MGIDLQQRMSTAQLNCFIKQQGIKQPAYSLRIGGRTLTVEHVASVIQSRITLRKEGTRGHGY